ncbi:MAG TPA: hypothetical protein VFF11_00880, partial [Candidatus Binatia bacterium]|nr:hypothetical protein [Candidatus Binatia bacterium]
MKHLLVERVSCISCQKPVFDLVLFVHPVVCPDLEKVADYENKSTSFLRGIKTAPASVPTCRASVAASRIHLDRTAGGHR